MPKKHALLSPSGAERWLTCGPSAKLEFKMPDRSTTFADEGTFAHWLSIDVIIAYAVGKLSKQQHDTELAVARECEYYSISLHEYCNDFKSYVIEQYNRLRAIDPHTVIFLETNLDLSMFIPEGFGTADIIIIGAGKLILIDLKYGQGVPVESEDNAQLKVYGLGAIARYEALFDINIIELHIFQPRIDNTSSWIVSAHDLQTWGYEVLKPGAAAAYAGHGEYVPGEHCQFCRVRPTCEALSKYVLKAAKYEKLPGTISPEQMSDILLKAGTIKGWLSAVTDFALTQAVNYGVKWPGFKVVEGISRRQINDEDAAIKILQGLKYAKSDYTNTGLKAIGDLEELVGGKKKFASLFEKVIHKPKGKPTLVPETDKREQFNDIQSAFADLDVETE